MERKEIIIDRIKGCLAAVALSDALYNLKESKGITFYQAFEYNRDYKSKPVPEQYMHFYEGKNITDRMLFVGFKGSPTMPTSDWFRALMDCMYALMMWRKDLQKNGIYTDPTEYINLAVDKSVWTEDIFGSYRLSPYCITSISVGLLGNMIFDFSEEINRDIRAVSTNPINNLRFSDDEEYNAEVIKLRKTQYGIFAIMLRNLIIHEGYVEAPQFYNMYKNCAIMDQYGDEEFRAFLVEEANTQLNYMANSDDSFGQLVRDNLKWQSWRDVQADTINGILYGRICYSAILGCINGYDSIPFKDMFKYVEVMNDIDKLIDEIGKIV